MTNDDATKKPLHFQIEIDGQSFTVTEKHMTGEELRALPSPPISTDRDLYESRPGQSDPLIKGDERVTITDGLSFFSAEAGFTIQIDRTQFQVTEKHMTGAQLRELSTPPIAADRDLYEIRPGQDDPLIENETRVAIRDGLRFFTAPGRINPGSGA